MCKYPYLMCKTYLGKIIYPNSYRYFTDLPKIEYSCFACSLVCKLSWKEWKKYIEGRKEGKGLIVTANQVSSRWHGFPPSTMYARGHQMVSISIQTQAFSSFCLYGFNICVIFIIKDPANMQILPVFCELRGVGWAHPCLFASASFLVHCCGCQRQASSLPVGSFKPRNFSLRSRWCPLFGLPCLSSGCTTTMILGW